MKQQLVGDILIGLSVALTLGWLIYSYILQPLLARRVARNLKVAETGSPAEELLPAMHDGFERVETPDFIYDWQMCIDEGMGSYRLDIILIKEKFPLTKVDSERALRTAILAEVVRHQEKVVQDKLRDTPMETAFSGSNLGKLIDEGKTQRAFINPMSYDKLPQSNDFDYEYDGDWNPCFLFNERVRATPGIKIWEYYLLGPKGIYRLHTSNRVLRFSHYVRLTRDTTDEWATIDGRVQTCLFGFNRAFVLELEVPLMTEEVIKEMMSKDMTNIPYIGLVYDQAGYKVVEVRMDNEVYLFCDVETYEIGKDLELRGWNDSIAPSELLKKLIEFRTTRGNHLVSEDYGFSYREGGVSVYWYV